MIKEKHLPSLQGMFPSWITSCSKDGEPNTTVISQIWYVDEKHVALSFQFSIKHSLPNHLKYLMNSFMSLNKVRL